MKQILGVMILVMIALFPCAAHSEMADARMTVEALKQGGHVVVMRHARSPKKPPSAARANSDNPRLERELDTEGRIASERFGNSLRRLNIPIGEVLTSPTYRARETAGYARLPDPLVVPELGDGGQSMQGVSAANADFLRRLSARQPQRGNTFIITHQPNLQQAFPEWGGDIDDGEIAVLRGKDGGSELVGRVRIEEWPNLAARALGN